MKEMNLLLSTDRNFLYPAYVTVASVAACHKEVALTFYLLCGADVTEEDRSSLTDFAHSLGAEVRFPEVDPSLYHGYAISERFPTAAYYRLLAHLILPAEAHRVLYLDVDLVANGDLYEDFYSRDFGGKYLIATSHNPDPTFYNALTARNVDLEAAARGELFNSGVLLINLDRFREEVITMEDYRRAYESCERRGFPVFYDQGLLNYMYFDKTLYLSSMDYNFRFSIPKDYARRLDPKRRYRKAILHYTGMRVPYKPWDLVLTDEEIDRYGAVPYSDDFFYVSRELNELNRVWWRYAETTPVYAAIKAEAEIKTKWFRRYLMDFTLKHNETARALRAAPPPAASAPEGDFHPRAYKLGCAITKPYRALRKLFDKGNS